MQNLKWVKERSFGKNNVNIGVELHPFLFVAKNNFYFLPFSALWAVKALHCSILLSQVLLIFAIFSELSTLSIREFWFSWSIHFFISLPNSFLHFGFQFRSSFVMPLDHYTCSSQLIFLSVSICSMASFPKRSLNFILRSYFVFSCLLILHWNFLSRTASFLSSSFYVGHILHAYMRSYLFNQIAD